MSPVVMLSPCGTSTLTNRADGPIRALLSRTANAKPHDLTPTDREQLEAYIEQRRQAILAAGLTEARQWSAELNGLLSYYQGQLPPKNDIHILLATATYQGQQTAHLIAQWLEQHGCPAQIHTVSPDLNVGQAQAFRVAMADLVEWVENTLPGYRQKGYRVVFNLTGGFKSVNGFLQTLGMFYADECVYIFQDSQELIRIPRLPVKLEAEAMVGENLECFRRLARGEALPLDVCRPIPETLLFIDEQKALLSEWGKLVWSRCKDDYYRRELLEPLSPKMRYTEAFRQAVRALPPDRRAIVNHRLDQLSAYLDGLAGNLASLDFKPLRGNPCPPATHECDAWHDQDARRIFGHFEGEVFVIDRLDKGLH